MRNERMLRYVLSATPVLAHTPNSVLAADAPARGFAYKVEGSDARPSPGWSAADKRALMRDYNEYVQ